MAPRSRNGRAHVSDCSRPKSHGSLRDGQSKQSEKASNGSLLVRETLGNTNSIDRSAGPAKEFALKQDAAQLLDVEEQIITGK